MLKILSVVPKDKKQIFSIAAKMWDGDDYIHEVFDEWCADKIGIFVAVWKDNKIIAFGRMTDLGHGDIWLEGLRKDPDVKSVGIGKVISNYIFNQLRNRKIRSIRFATYFDNIASIKLNEKRGFKKILTLSLKTREPKKAASNFTMLDFNPTLEEVVGYMRQSRYLHQCKNFISIGWVVYPFNTDFIKKSLSRGDITVYRKNNLVEGIMISSETHYKYELWLSYLDGDSTKAVKCLLGYADMIAEKREKKEILVLVPDNSLLKQVTTEDDFISWEQENDFFLYELPLEKL